MSLILKPNAFTNYFCLNREKKSCIPTDFVGNLHIKIPNHIFKS